MATSSLGCAPKHLQVGLGLPLAAVAEVSQEPVLDEEQARTGTNWKAPVPLVSPRQYAYLKPSVYFFTLSPKYSPILTWNYTGKTFLGCIVPNITK